MIELIENAIYTAVYNNATISSLVSNRIYLFLAPAGSAFPYIVFNFQTGGDMNITPRQALDLRYTVKAVSTTPTEARNLSAAIREALHNVDLSIGGAWAAYACQHETAITYLEQTERRQFYHAGGVYRIRAHTTI